MQIMMRWLAAAALMTLTSQVRASCTFGASDEMSLQGVFDSVLAPGLLSAANDCIASSADTLWTAQGPAVATIIIELAGFAGSNRLGIYDPLNPKSQQVSVFPGSASGGSTTTLELIPRGGGYDVFANGTVEGHFATSAFGFFLKTPQNHTFFSQPGLNGDGADHMYAYRGNGASFSGGPLTGATFATSMYLLAFEDLWIPHGDSDFQDFVATVNLIAPIPLPPGAWLLGSMLALLLVSRRRFVANSTLN